MSRSLSLTFSLFFTLSLSLSFLSLALPIPDALYVPSHFAAGCLNEAVSTYLSIYSIRCLSVYHYSI